MSSLLHSLHLLEQRTLAPAYEPPVTYWAGFPQGKSIFANNAMVLPASNSADIMVEGAEDAIFPVNKKDARGLAGPQLEHPMKYFKPGHAERLLRKRNADDEKAIAEALDDTIADKLELGFEEFKDWTESEKHKFNYEDMTEEQQGYKKIEILAKHVSRGALAQIKREMQNDNKEFIDFAKKINKLTDAEVEENYSEIVQEYNQKINKAGRFGSDANKLHSPEFKEKFDDAKSDFNFRMALYDLRNGSDEKKTELLEKYKLERADVAQKRKDKKAEDAKDRARKKKLAQIVNKPLRAAPSHRAPQPPQAQVQEWESSTLLPPMAPLGIRQTRYSDNEFKIPREDDDIPVVNIVPAAPYSSPKKGEKVGEMATPGHVQSDEKGEEYEDVEISADIYNPDVLFIEQPPGDDKYIKQAELKDPEKAMQAFDKYKGYMSDSTKDRFYAVRVTLISGKQYIMMGSERGAVAQDVVNLLGESSGVSKHAIATMIKEYSEGKEGPHKFYADWQNHVINSIDIDIAYLPRIPIQKAKLKPRSLPQGKGPGSKAAPKAEADVKAQADPEAELEAELEAEAKAKAKAKPRQLPKPKSKPKPQPQALAIVQSATPHKKIGKGAEAEAEAPVRAVAGKKKQKKNK